MDLDQRLLPITQEIEIRPEEIARKKTLGASIELCAELAGFSLDKQLSDGLGFDKGQFSRWQSGGEGIIWPKLVKIMDFCGNDAPVLWMNHERGWDLNAMRKLQTETEKVLAEERAKRQQAEEKVRFLMQVMQGKVPA